MKMSESGIEMFQNMKYSYLGKFKIEDIYATFISRRGKQNKRDQNSTWISGNIFFYFLSYFLLSVDFYGQQDTTVHSRNLQQVL